MLFLNNAFTKDITEYDGEVLKEVKTVDGKIYLSNGAIIKEGVVGKFFDIATNDKYGTVFEAGGPDEIGPIVGFAPVTGDSVPIILHSDYRSYTNCGRAIRFAAFFLFRFYDFGWICRFYKLLLEFYAEIYVAYNCYLC